MRKKREFTEGAFYHVVSRTNDKIRVFENRLGRKIMLMTLQDAKDKFRFCLTNFCIMPTHFHLLIKPEKNPCLSAIMQWIKTNSAKRWNHVHGSKDHLWGHRYFGAYAEVIDKLYTLIPTIPRLGESSFLQRRPICLHYFTGAARRFWCLTPIRTARGKNFQRTGFHSYSDSLMIRFNASHCVSLTPNPKNGIVYA